MAMTTEEAATDLKEDLAILRADLNTLMAAVKNLGVEQSRMAYDRLRETGEQARIQVREAQETVEHYIEARPLASVLVAFGAGFAIGSLIGNRR
jgi:ElaB/YqjD/DUF883 family membrane-anchored ribosome-binding protein